MSARERESVDDDVASVASFRCSIRGFVRFSEWRGVALREDGELGDGVVLVRESAGSLRMRNSERAFRLGQVEGGRVIGRD